MPEAAEQLLKRQPRIDGSPGWMEITRTAMGFVELDDSDPRMGRVRVFDATGNLVKTYLVDAMGVPWADLPDVLDDL